MKMRRMESFKRGNVMIAAYYFWDGISYGHMAARLRYVMMRAL